jgi:hypothetical protein
LLGRGDDGKKRQSNSDLQLNKSPKKRKNGKDRGGEKKEKKTAITEEENWSAQCSRIEESKNRRHNFTIQRKEFSWCGGSATASAWPPWLKTSFVRDGLA